MLPRNLTRYSGSQCARSKWAEGFGIAQARSPVVEQLISDRINRWRHEIAASGMRVRTKKHLEKPARRPPPANDEERRKRRASANRVLTMLKAALNRAYNAGRVPSDAAWRKVKPFRGADAPVIHYLSAESAATGRPMRISDYWSRPHC
jgi:hypothetical protein